MTEYEACVMVIAEHIEKLEQERKQLLDERRDLRDELGTMAACLECGEFVDLVAELHDVRQQLAALHHLVDNFEERVRELLQVDAMNL